MHAQQRRFVEVLALALTEPRPHRRSLRDARDCRQRRLDVRERSARERDEIRRQWLGRAERPEAFGLPGFGGRRCAVADCAPLLRDPQRHVERGLEIRLVEARIQPMRVGWHDERVAVFGSVRGVAIHRERRPCRCRRRTHGESKLVLALAQQVRRHDEVVGGAHGIPFRPVHTCRCAQCAVEVDDQRFAHTRVVEHEAHRRVAVRVLHWRGDPKRELVADVRDRRGPSLCERRGYAWHGVLGLHDEQHQGEREEHVRGRGG